MKSFNDNYEDNFEDEFQNSAKESFEDNFEDNSVDNSYNDLFEKYSKETEKDDFEDITSNSEVSNNGIEDIVSNSNAPVTGFEDLSSNSENISSFGKNDVSKQSAVDLNSFASKDDKKSAKRKNGKSKTKNKTVKQRIIKIVLSTFLIGVIVVTMVIGAFVLYAFTMIDPTMPQDLNDLKLNFTTTIYVKDNATGEFVEYQRLYGQYKRIWVEYNPEAAKKKDKEYTGIPQDLVNAFVAIEDKRFYSHYGVDWKRTTSAFANMFFHFYDTNQGGSTITQQLVKNLTQDDEQKASRKLREIMRARYLESHYSKDTIMECYLNIIALGHNLSGVGVASNYYFGKNVNELTLAECATIAAITKSPVKYAPDTNPKENEGRRNEVLKQMYSQGYITKKEYNKAKKEKINTVSDSSRIKENTINNYAVDAIITQVTKEIAKKKNFDMKRASNDFYNGGYKIYATIDPNIQNCVDKVFQNPASYGITARSGNDFQASMTILDYKGHVVALSGGIGQKTENLGYNRALQAVRQPGSTMKPIAAYAPAIEKKLKIEGKMATYSTIVPDFNKTYNLGSKKWKPNNWYNSHWSPKTIQYAIMRSMNTIPVEIVDLLTPEYCYDFLTKKLGITTLNEEDKNLSPLGMGGTNGGLTTFESAAAYAIFGNGGRYYAPCLYYKVCDQYDNVVLENKDKSNYAISSDTATVMNKILQTVVDDKAGTGHGIRDIISSNMKIYAKTGTSNNANDLWFVGGTPYYVASCWCGYDTPKDVKPENIAWKLWGNVMKEVHANLPGKDFDLSPDVRCYKYCTATGDLATDKCPATEIGWYRKNGLPSVCKSHAGTALPMITTAKEEKKAS